MKLNNILLHKITLFTLTIATTSMPSYGMMPRLRLILDKGLGAATAYRSTLQPSALAPALNRYSRQNNALDLRFLSSKNSKSKEQNNFKFSLPLATGVGIIGSTTIAFCQDLSTQEKQDQELFKLLNNSDPAIKDHESFLEAMTHNASQKTLCSFFIKNPSLFTEDQKRKFLDRHLIYLVNNFHPDHIKKLVSDFILEQESELQLYYLDKRPGLFTEQQQKIIITRHANYFIDHFPISKFSQFEIGAQTLLHDLLIKKGDPDQILAVVRAREELFSEAEQYDLMQKLQDKFLAYPTWNDEVLKLPLHCKNALYALYAKKYKEAHAATTDGPLFSDYLLKNYPYLINFLSSEYQHSNFYNLFPIVSEHAQQEYANNRIVLFHGQRADWMLLGRIYNRLRSLDPAEEHPNFIHLRFQRHSDLSENEVQEIRKNGKFYPNVHKIKHDPILFTNLHPSANNRGDNSWEYAMRNHDMSGKNVFEIMLPQLFENLDLSQEYDTLRNNSPKIFAELYQLFTEAIKEQGNHGRLLVISMPADLAKKITYATDYYGKPKPCQIKDRKTTDTTEIERDYDHVPFENQFALILSEEIINPEAAAKAGVKIVGFDPAFYWQTEKSQKVIEKLDEIIELIRKTKEKHAPAAAFLGFLQRETP